jgi:excisionase family DNA binding protein
MRNMQHDRDGRGERLLTTAETADYLNVSRRTLSRWLREGIGPPSIKLPSGARRYRKADLDRWIAEHQADG